MNKGVLFGCLFLSLALSNCASSQKQAPANSEEIVASSKNVTDAIAEFNEYAKNNAIYFAFDSDKVNKKEIINNYKEQLANISKLKQVKLTINGYCDAVGDEEYNYNLGLRRANAVKGAINKEVKNNIKLNVKSYGKSKVENYSDDKKENDKLNRKVVIIAE